MEAQDHGTHCAPTEPAPTNEGKECSGRVSIECCCPQLRTRTMILTVNPQTEPNASAYLQNTVAAFETAGYLILGHSITDIGAGWLVGLTYGWYQ